MRQRDVEKVDFLQLRDELVSKEVEDFVGSGFGAFDWLVLEKEGMPGACLRLQGERVQHRKSGVAKLRLALGRGH